MNVVGVALEGVSIDGTVRPTCFASSTRTPLASIHGIGAESLVRELFRCADVGQLATVRVDYFASLLALGAPKVFSRNLWSGGRAKLGDYTLNLIPALCLWIEGPERTIRVNDLQRWLPVDPAESAALFTPGRDAPAFPRRWEWNNDSHDVVMAHAQQTADWCAAAADGLWDALTDAELARYLFDGTGRVAGHLMGKLATPEDVMRPPDRLERAIATGYGGGRMATFQVGSFDRITQIDLRSAYPWAMTQLPSLDRARYVRKRVYDLHEPYALWEVWWDIPHGAPSGPFPVRTERGGIAWPLCGFGWYWADEVRAAIECYGHAVRPISGVAIRPRSDHRPFAGLEDIYDRRRALKADGNRAAAHVLKLTMNACYGRLVRVVDHDGSPGKWGNLALAGMTTSAVRAKMLRELMNHETRTIALATDSLTVAGDVDIVASDNLGGWDVTTGGVSLMLPSGVFHVQHGAAAMDRMMGVERSQAMEVDWPMVHEGWELMGLGFHWPIPVRSFVGLGMAGATNRWGSLGQWQLRRHDIVGKPAHAKPVRVAHRQWRLLPSPTKPMRSARYVPKAGALARVYDQPDQLTVDVAREHDQPFA